MALTRRRILAGALVIPVLVVADALRARLSTVTAALRPPAAGTSATRCAACGSAEHAMLDPRCPARPVLG